jgi:hypothetical protein
VLRRLFAWAREERIIPANPALELRTGWGGSVRRRVIIPAWVNPDQLGDPTPCPDHDVATLIDHLIGASWLGVALSRGESPARMEFPHIELADAPDQLRRAGQAAEAAWSDDARLAATVTMPWGQILDRSDPCRFARDRAGRPHLGSSGLHRAARPARPRAGSERSLGCDCRIDVQPEHRSAGRQCLVSDRHDTRFTARSAHSAFASENIWADIKRCASMSCH